MKLCRCEYFVIIKAETQTDLIIFHNPPYNRYRLLMNVMKWHERRSIAGHFDITFYDIKNATLGRK